MVIPQNLIIPLDSQLAQLHNAGGKGANLSKLLRAGFSVPPGFIVTTAAYLEYVKRNSFTSKIEQLVSQIDPKDSQQLEAISTQIRGKFDTGQILPEIKERIQSAFENLDRQSVAVRSSATAEDLPGISFAGQQDTFLNITNPDNLIKAVISSWSSLWTARAIGYRTRHGIPQDQLAMAVIIQEMVPSFSSGVLFTANPLTGSRTEMVIDATFGLGEALVSGQVEPDHYLVEHHLKKVLDRKIGSKSIAMYIKESGGFSILDIAAKDELVLSDKKVFELAELGNKIADLFEFPQDIEWGIANDQIYILQSRPITTLYPLPDGISAKPLRALFSFGAIQGILDPFTPLGQDAIRLIFAGGASLFGVDLNHETQPVIKIGGQRLWANMTPLIQNPVGARVIPRIFSAIDPSLQNILASLSDEPDLRVGEGRLQIKTVRRILKFVLPFGRQVVQYIKSPQGVADQVRQDSENEIKRLREKYDLDSGKQATFQERVDLFREIFNAFPYAVPKIAFAAAGGIIPFFLLNKFSEKYTGSNQISLEITRGLENNVTTEMDLELWRTAHEIRSDQNSYQYILSRDSSELAKLYLTGQLPNTAQTAIASFLKKYGVRGLGEIDIGRKRWREDPAYIIELIISYVQIKDPSLAPDAIFERGKLVAADAIQKLQIAVQDSFAGKLKSRIIGELALRVRELAGLRESPKFHIIQIMGLIRGALLDSGQSLVEKGLVDRPDDIFFLYLDELEMLTEGNDTNWRTIVGERRDHYQRELMRTQIPRLILSDGRSYYEGLTPGADDKGLLVGSPVSPGLVEGNVRVVVDPINPGLQPGEIMVCQGTDPAWTPLFLTAAGVIMEVGGMMTHGAIVAREYGIPAVVGVSQATQVLQSGQRIQLNGSTGEILLLET